MSNPNEPFEVEQNPLPFPLPDPPSPPEPLDLSPLETQIAGIPSMPPSQPRLTPEPTPVPNEPPTPSSLPEVEADTAAKKKVAVSIDGATKVVEVPEPLKRKCELKQVLPAGVIQLLASAPHNETVRNVLLAHLKVQVPLELKSFKDIQDWIEFNIDPPSIPVAKMKTAPGRSNELVQVHIMAKEREYGSCNYSEDVRGSGNIGLTRDEVLSCAADADDEEEFWDMIRNHIYERDISDHISMDSVEGTRSYADHERNDGEGINVTIQPSGHDTLKQLIRDLDPEAYERLWE